MAKKKDKKVEPIEIKEKDIVNEIILRWKEFFPDIEFWRKEYALRDFRVDIAASVGVNLKDLNIRDTDYILKQGMIFFEVKYNSNMRDLLFELQKQIKFRNWYVDVAKCFLVICVISDDFNSHMVEYMQRNNVLMYKLKIKDNNLSTLTINEYDPINDLAVKEIEESLLI